MLLLFRSALNEKLSNLRGNLISIVPKCEIFDRSDFHDFFTIKSLWEGDLGVKIAIFKNLAFLGTLKIIKNIAFLTRIPRPLCASWAYGSGLLRTSSVRVRNWCTPWPYASVPDTHAQHTHKFSYFSNVPFCIPSAWWGGVRLCGFQQVDYPLWRLNQTLMRRSTPM